MKKEIMIIAGLALLLTSALAVPTNTYQLIYELSKHHGPYNKMLADYGLGDANFIITMYRGTKQYRSYTDAQGYARLHTGRKLNPSITIWTTQWTIDKILNSADPKAAFDQAVKNKEIKISGKTNWDKIRVKKAIRIPRLKISLKNILPRLATKLSPSLGQSQQAQQAQQGTQQLPTFTQNAAGQPCGNLAYRIVPMGGWRGANIQCGQGLTCYNGYCIRSQYVPQIPSGTQTGNKRPGQKCNHAGECITGHCVKIPYSGTFGSYSPATFACSCEEYRYVTNC